MNGMLSTRKRQNGRMLPRITIIIVISMVFFSACSFDWWVGDGRGDWTLELHKGYAISKINSREILLVYKENPDDPGGSIVLPNYFITAYQQHEPFIYLEGIRTREITASEDELNSMMLSYYLIDTTNAEIVGPFESYDDFINLCTSLGLEGKGDWIETYK